MTLTEKQEQRIHEIVDRHGFQIQSLRDDVVDHLCCVVEERQHEGLPFDKLLEEAIADLAPNGLIDIEEQTLFLLNFNRIVRMKKTIYFIGFLGAAVLTGGILFKLLNMAGANELFITGYIILLLIFIPLRIFDRYKTARTKPLNYRFMYILGFASSVIAGMAGIFKILQWNGANILLVTGTIVFVLGYLPFLFIKLYRKSLS